MPRNGSGTYTLPAGNPVTSGALIEASWANTTMSDLASAITDSLARNGEGGMTAPLRFADGSVGAPGFSWTNETATGIYRSGSGDMRVSLQGVDVGIWNSTGLTIPSAKALSAQGNATVNGTLGVGTTSLGSGTKVEVRSTNTITDARGIVAINSTNTAGANLGGSISFGGENGQATTPYVFGSVAGRYEGTGYAGYLQFNVTNSAGVVTERGRINSDGVLAVPAGMITATQTSGTNNTTVATTSFVNTAVNAAIQALHPVGSIYINATNSANPATLLGFGTWVAFGAGRVPVGFNASNPLFDAAEETGGSADAINVAHTHTFSATTGTQSADHTHGGTTNSAGTHSHGLSQILSNTNVLGNQGYYDRAAGGTATSFTTDSAGAHTHTFTTNGVSADHTHNVSGSTASTGSSGTNANYQPYITVYMWKRTA